jgi:uncharacterized protein YgiM (DUF1202 family)
MNKKFNHIALLSLLCGFLLTINFAASPVSAAQPAPVLAFYYAWFDQNTWASGQSVDLPSQPYSSADRVTIERQVQQAQGAGIDAFVQSWYGPQEANNQTETNFRTLLEVAAAAGFKAAVDVETGGPFFGDAGAVSSALSTLLATHAQHPAYLRFEGKPVIFFWRQQRFDVDQWAAIRATVDPNRTTFWIAEGTDLAYQAVFDGHHLYSLAWADSPTGQLTRWGDRVRAYETANQVDRLWVATAMPGYNDTRLPRANAFAVDRRGGDYFRETWQGAVASQPDMIIINSFNEWPEGTHLEPSAAYGNLYLDITRELVTGWRGSPPAAPAAIQAAQTQESTPQPPPAGPYVRIEGLTNVRTGPDTGFAKAGALSAGEAAVVVGKTQAGDWWQIEFAPGPNGLGWVLAEIVEFAGNAADVPVVETASTPEPPQSAQPVINIPAGGTNVRRGPGLNFDTLGRLEQGQTAPVLGKNESSDWWQIEYPAGDNGLAWVAAAVVDFSGDSAAVPVVKTAAPAASQPAPTGTPVPTPTPAPITGQIEVKDPINVRSEPSLEGVIVGGLYPGDTTTVLSISPDGQWWQVEFADGPDGTAWVAVEFVTFAGDPQAMPIFGLGTPTPTPGPTNTPTATRPRATPTPLELPPTYAPTATSVYQATSAAIVSARGTPDPAVRALPSQQRQFFSRDNFPWGVLSLIVVGAVLWYQLFFRKRR